MPTPETLALRPETAVYLINVALAASLICGLALAAVWLGRKSPAPVRHGILTAALMLLLLCPLFVWLGQSRGLVQWSVGKKTAVEMPTVASRNLAVQPSAVATAQRQAGSPAVVADPAPKPDLSTGTRPASSIPEASMPPAVRLAWWQLLGSLAAGLWLVGIVGGALRLAWGYGILLRLRRSFGTLTDEHITRLAKQVTDSLGLKQPPPVLTSSLVPVPLSLGLWRPAVILPANLAQETDEQELEAVLIHEVAHIARRDHWIGLVQRGVTILFWWNPLVWKLGGQISELREEICDNYVLTCHGEGHRLARVLLDLVARVSDHRPLPVSIGVLEPRLAGFAGRIKRLVNKEHDMSTCMSRVSMLMVALGSLAVLATTILWEGIQVVYAQEPAATAVPNPAPAAPAAESFTFRGHVLDPNGKPVQGAKIFVVQMRPDAPLPVKLRATTGPDGAFQFTMAKAELTSVDVSVAGAGASIMAVAEGFGPTLGFAAMFEPSGEILGNIQRVYPCATPRATREPVLKLVDDNVPLAGRIVDFQGRPVAGVSVRVRELYGSPNGDLTAWLREAEQPNGDFYKARMHLDISMSGKYVWQQLQEILPSATTDADGRFTLRGLGRERVVSLFIAGPAIATQAIETRTQRGPTLFLTSGPAAWTYYGAAFEHVAQSTVPIVGTVRDRKTGQPLAGVTIQSHRLAGNPVIGMSDFIRTVTDAQGRYRLVGMPVGKENSLLAVPPADQPYLIVTKGVPLQAGQASATADFELERGIWIRGRVTDARTGAPVRGHVEYFVVLENLKDKSAPPFESTRYHYLIDKDGRYAIPGLPRRGIVTVSANEHERYSRAAGADKIDAPRLNVGAEVFVTAPTWCCPSDYHMLVAINPPKEAESVEQDFVLNPHQVLHGTVLGPEGQPLAGTSYFGLGDFTGWRSLDSARFTVFTYQPDHPRTLLFVQQALKLAGGKVLQGKVEEPLTVQLQPWGIALGRALDDQGKPLGKAKLRDNLQFPEKSGQGEIPEPEYVMTDEEGQFRIEGLVPGMTYRLCAEKDDVVLGVLGSKFSVASGETKDLGDLKVGPDSPATP
jgi:beta-lactamase regulating signal transducer with metallopeptidase domain/protocatechuate 3,4-dioxygenase beta subunit